eukprot:scaffold32486_cov71-Phaeocystis_antarctica.AAC.1
MPELPDRAAMRARSIHVPALTLGGTIIFVRTAESPGPPRESRHRRSAGVEPPSARPHSNRTGKKPDHRLRAAHALSVYPPWLAQMSRGRRAAGRYELALRLRSSGCRSTAGQRARR